MDVSENRGTPKWMVYNGKPYFKMWWFGGTTIFGNTHLKKCQSRGFFDTPQSCFPAPHLESEFSLSPMVLNDRTKASKIQSASSHRRASEIHQKKQLFEDMMKAYTPRKTLTVWHHLKNTGLKREHHLPELRFFGFHVKLTRGVSKMA